MKNILIVLITLAIGFSFTQAAAFSKDVKYRTTKVLITSEKPLSTGLNTFVLEISKNSKSLQESTQVRVKAFMPAMPGMPAMESKADAERLENGKYKVTFNFAMGGTWQVHIFIKPVTGKKSRVKTSINF